MGLAVPKTWWALRSCVRCPALLSLGSFLSFSKPRGRLCPRTLKGCYNLRPPKAYLCELLFVLVEHKIVSKPCHDFWIGMKTPSPFVPSLSEWYPWVFGWPHVISVPVDGKKRKSDKKNILKSTDDAGLRTTRIVSRGVFFFFDKRDVDLKIWGVFFFLSASQPQRQQKKRLLW